MGSRGIGDRLREARKAKGLSQLGLAVLIRRTPGMVYRWEAGAVSPSADTITRLASSLGVSESWLLTGAEARGGSNPLTLAAIREFAGSPLAAGVEPWKLDALRQCNLDAIRPTLQAIYALACATDWPTVAGAEERTTTRPALSRRR